MQEIVLVRNCEWLPFYNDPVPSERVAKQCTELCRIGTLGQRPFDVLDASAASNCIAVIIIHANRSESGSCSCLVAIWWRIGQNRHYDQFVDQTRAYSYSRHTSVLVVRLFRATIRLVDVGLRFLQTLAKRQPSNRLCEIVQAYCYYSCQAGLTWPITLEFKVWMRGYSHAVIYHSQTVSHN